ncbi:hypothetical protein A6R68_13440, partial [Neotoma lepida]
MSFSALSPIRFAGSISGFLQVVSVLGLLLLLLKAVQFYLHRQWLLKAFQQFPSPPFHWFFGHKQFQGDQELPEIMKCVEKFPNAFPRWFWGSKVYFTVYDPDYMKVILGRSDPKDNGAYRLLAPWIGYGLLLLNGQPWFQHRRMLTPAFHYDILKPYVKTMADSVRLMLICCPFYNRVCFCNCYYYHSFIIIIIIIIITIIIIIFLFFLLLILILPSPSLLSLSISIFTYSECTPTSSIYDKWERLAGQDSSIEIFQDISLMTLDTVMKCAFSHKGSVQVDGDHLDQMPYTTMCIKEALRLYPPVPGIAREISKPITFPDGRSLPKGVSVTLSIYALHHNPKVWPNPEVFDPSRFAPDSPRHSHSFLPFSGGA